MCTAQHGKSYISSAGEKLKVVRPECSSTCMVLFIKVVLHVARATLHSCRAFALTGSAQEACRSKNSGLANATHPKS